MVRNVVNALPYGEYYGSLPNLELNYSDYWACHDNKLSMTGSEEIMNIDTRLIKKLLTNGEVKINNK